MQSRYQQWIGGEAVPPKAGRYLDSANPANGEKLTEIARGDADDAAAASSASPRAISVSFSPLAGFVEAR